KQIPAIMTTTVGSDSSEFRCHEPGLGVGETAAVELGLPAGCCPSGVDDDVGPAAAVDIGIPVVRQPLPDLGAQFLISHDVRLRSAADSVPGAARHCPAAGRRSGLAADTGAPDAPR